MKATIDHMVTELEKLNQESECTDAVLAECLVKAEHAAAEEKANADLAKQLCDDHANGKLQREATMFREGRITVEVFLSLAQEKLSASEQ